MHFKDVKVFDRSSIPYQIEILKLNSVYIYIGGGGGGGGGEITVSYRENHNLAKKNGGGGGGGGQSVGGNSMGGNHRQSIFGKGNFFWKIG